MDEKIMWDLCELGPEGPMAMALPSALPEDFWTDEDFIELTHDGPHLMQEMCQTEECPAPKDKQEASGNVQSSKLSVGNTYCDKCHKPFRQMKKHMLSHTGEKPFSCKECGCSFSQKSNLNRHVKSKHDDSFETCKHCEKQFKRKDKLKGHTRKAHPDKTENNPAA